MRLAQRANRKTALFNGHQIVPGAGGELLEPSQQTVIGGQLIDAAATRWAVAEVGRNKNQLCLGELAQGECSQDFVFWMD